MRYLIEVGFLGKAGPELRSQPRGGRAHEMHPESDGGPHLWASSKGVQRHVAGFGSQVGSEQKEALDQLLPMITFCCLKQRCGFSSAFVTTTEALWSVSLTD